jgi:MarR family transcriptional regulator, transcriptional regulator for hemolysin
MQGMHGRGPRMARERPGQLGFLIHDVSRLRRTVVDKALRPLGVTRSQWWVLSSLSRHQGSGLVQTELSRILDVGKVTLGGLIDRLEVRGYVRRRPLAGDRRAKRVLMTGKGARLLAQIHKVAKVVNAEIMTGISAGDVARVETVLRKMKDQLIAMDAVPGSSDSDMRES